MALYLLDTNIISYILADDPQVKARANSIAAGDQLCTSVIVAGELLFGLERLPGGRRRDDLAVRMAEAFRYVPPMPLPVDAATTYARLKQYVQRGGVTLEDNDLWIAATAIGSRCILVSADSDMQLIPGLALENWVV